MAKVKAETDKKPIAAAPKPAIDFEVKGNLFNDNTLLKKVFTEENISKLRSSSKTISLDGKEINITYHNSNFPVFELETFPDIIFKFSNAKTRFENEQKAKKICEENNLNLLIVPESSLIQLPGHDIIAEKKYPIEHENEKQRWQFERKECQTEEIVKQLTLFICKTNFSDVKWNNIPLTNQNGLKVALIDLEDDFDSFEALTGLWGRDSTSIGLIYCFPKYASTIYSIAEQHLKADLTTLKKWCDTLQNRYDQEFSRENEIVQFHKDHGITRESLPIPSNTPLKLDKKSYEWNDLKESFIPDFITAVNNKIAKQKDDPNLAHARELKFTTYLSENEDGSFDEDDCLISRNFYLIKDKILPQLKELGIVHSILNRDEALNFNADLRQRLYYDDDLIVQF